MGLLNTRYCDKLLETRAVWRWREVRLLPLEVWVTRRNICLVRWALVVLRFPCVETQASKVPCCTFA